MGSSIGLEGNDLPSKIHNLQVLTLRIKEDPVGQLGVPLSGLLTGLSLSYSILPYNQVLPLQEGESTVKVNSLLAGALAREASRMHGRRRLQLHLANDEIYR